MQETHTDEPKVVGIGDSAPDAELTPTEGAPVRLSDYWTKQPVVLVFLRHLGCIFCREQVGLLRGSYQKFASAGVEVICVAQGDAKTGKAFSILMDLPYPILMCGDDVSVFRAYGLGRGSAGQLFGLPSILRGFQAFFAGFRQGAVVGDGFQMPGIFVVDRGGIVRFVHRHRHAGDNPDTAGLVAIGRQMQAAGAAS
jgi:peroxiredoxin